MKTTEISNRQCLLSQKIYKTGDR